MTTDTHPLAPTDAEIWQLWVPMARKGVADPVDFARAVLAKWGAQPVVREPLTDEGIREWWASENALEDRDMCKLADFSTVVRAVEEMHRIKGGLHP